MRDHTPQQFDFAFGLWTLSLIRELIKRQFGKSLALESVRRIMKLLGFSAQKPLYQAWQQDPELVKKWEIETYPAIKAAARVAGGKSNCSPTVFMRYQHAHIRLINRPHAARSATDTLCDTRNHYWITR